jgi:L-ribulose-5-phosphate 3-epimerase
MKRRQFLRLASTAAGAIALQPWERVLRAAEPAGEPFKISLAEWSLVKSLKAGKLTNLDFPRVAKRDFGVEAVEFVDQFFADKAKDTAYLKDLKQRAADEGVYLHLIMLDTNGPLGAADKAKRDASVEKTLPWIDAAKFLGCRAVRINAYGDGNADELRERIVESCVRLADHAAPQGIDVCIENHGKLSSDPAWLASVMQAVNKPNFGTLPDFGNFPDTINHYDAVETLMSWAKAVSAKTGRFDADGMDVKTDYFRMMRIVRDAGWTGWVGIESGGPNAEGEAESIRRTRDLLLRVREAQKRCRPLFNGRDLDGWTKIEGGEWVIENGVLIGRNGQKWTTNPETTGSWLSTNKEYGDFRLEFQYTVNERGNSGVFFRSARAKNPAFTGYEFQIYDAPGRPPSKGGPTSLYDVAAPAKNAIRPAGQWNTVTIMAKGPRIRVEVNGEQVHDVELSRSLRGYVGLQNHDEKSVVKFRNVRLEEL